MTTSQEDRYQATHRVAIVGATVNVFLSISTILIGIFSQSAAVLADGLHSLSDLVSDMVVLFAARQSKRHADEQHPYGHARFETAATAAVGAILCFVALEFLLYAAGRLQNLQALPIPHWSALGITLVAIIAKELLYRYTMGVALRLNSNILKASAWHHRSDSISSIIVLVGVLGTLWGVVWLDTLAAMIVGLMIGHIGWSLVRQSFEELVDTALPSEKLDAIRNVIHAVPNVKELHELRTRRMGEMALVDVHILVDERISVSEGHQISETVRAHLIKQVDGITNVMVHIDSEDDAAGPLNVKLPLRDTVIKGLQQCWAPLTIYEQIEYINLHYLRGSIDVDVYLPLARAQDVLNAQQIADELQHLSQQLPYVNVINVFFSAAQNECNKTL